ncbi:MAG TPA: hypothetical protein VM425_12045 [Myxococcota bacterium]|nr:hypothetical protein [Myxococcota bacterium]
MRRYLPVLIFFAAITAGPACATIGVDRSKSMGKPVTGIPINKVPVKGYPVIVKLKSSDSGHGKYSGELLAVDKESVWIMHAGRSADHAQPFPIARSKIKKVEILDLYSSGEGGLGAWITLGTLSTASHGYFAIFSAPIWLLVGIPTTVAAAYANNMVAKPEDFHMLYQWACYPQGMPVAVSQPGIKKTVDGQAVEKKEGSAKDSELKPSAESSEETGTISDTEAQKKKPLDIQNVGAFTLGGIQTLWAMGCTSASAGQNPSLTRLAADMRARDALVKLIANETHTTISHESDDTNLEGIRIIDRWVDSKTGEHCSVAVIPLDKSGLAEEQAEHLFKRLIEELPPSPQPGDQTAGE